MGSRAGIVVKELSHIWGAQNFPALRAEVSPETRSRNPTWGPTLGRGVIHRLPGDGWLWDPGQGVTVEVINSDTARQIEEGIDISMLGHVVVT